MRPAPSGLSGLVSRRPRPALLSRAAALLVAPATLLVSLAVLLGSPAVARAEATATTSTTTTSTATTSTATTSTATTGPAAATTTAYAATAPTLGALDTDGQDNRYLLGGQWLMRLDPSNVGITDGYWRNRASTGGWTQTTMPNSFNAGNLSTASFLGSIAWYRRDFTLPAGAFQSYVPQSARDWVVQFESVNYYATVWLNGHLLGRHQGAYLPFQLTLKYLEPGVNRLVVRVSNQLNQGDFPPEHPGAGWWNFGGVLDAVYLMPVARTQIENLRIRTPMKCPSCSATIDERATIHNLSSRPESVTLTGAYGSAELRFGTDTLAPGATWTPTASVVIRHPRLWNPGAPQLYKATLRLSDTAGRTLTGYTFMSGIRTITVKGGILRVNGRQVHLRGVNMHEQTATTGAALSLPAMQQLISWVKELGATVIREHYPLDPEMEEMADADGIMLWSEIPAYHPQPKYQASASWRRRAVALLKDNIETNQDHPSILLWSIGNEFTSPPVPGQSTYIAQAAAAAHRLDPTRPVGMALLADPWPGCLKQYAPLQVIGVNVYFGSFQGGGALDNRESLGPFMQTVRRCYPHKAIFASEFGYDGGRSGPVEVKGTYQNQVANIQYALSVFDGEPWLAGALYHTIQDWDSSPGWDGEDPLGTPPLVDRGLIAQDGTPKPAYAVTQALYRATRQIGPIPKASKTRRAKEAASETRGSQAVHAGAAGS